MKSDRPLRISVFAGWLIVTLAIALIAHLIVPQANRSEYFWYHVLWAEALWLLFWVSVASYIPPQGAPTNARLGGISPTLSMVAATYAALSFSLMIIHSLMPEVEAIDRVHWILQILLFAGVALTIVMLFISRVGATTGLPSNSASAPTPRELHHLLALGESTPQIPSELKGSMKQLSETVLYSLNDSTTLRNMPAYQELSREIQHLCDTVSHSVNNQDSGPNRFDSLTASALGLVAKTKLVSANQKVVHS